MNTSSLILPRETRRARPTRSCSHLGRCLLWRMTGFSSLRAGLFASTLHGKSFTVLFRLAVNEGRKYEYKQTLRLADVLVLESTIPG